MTAFSSASMPASSRAGARLSIRNCAKAGSKTVDLLSEPAPFRMCGPTRRLRETLPGEAASRGGHVVKRVARSVRVTVADVVSPVGEEAAALCCSPVHRALGGCRPVVYGRPSDGPPTDGLPTDGPPSDGP